MQLCWHFEVFPVSVSSQLNASNSPSIYPLLEFKTIENLIIFQAEKIARIFPDKLIFRSSFHGSQLTARKQSLKKVNLMGPNGLNLGHMNIFIDQSYCIIYTA